MKSNKEIIEKLEELKKHFIFFGEKSGEKFVETGGHCIMCGIDLEKMIKFMVCQEEKMQTKDKEWKERIKKCVPKYAELPLEIRVKLEGKVLKPGVIVPYDDFTLGEVSGRNKAIDQFNSNLEKL